jgi:hypothetical protein
MPSHFSGHAQESVISHDLFVKPVSAFADHALEHFQAKWMPVRAKKMRQNKDLERFLIPLNLKTL